MIDQNSKWIGKLGDTYKQIVAREEAEKNGESFEQLDEAAKVSLNNRELKTHLAQKVRECATSIDHVYPTISDDEDPYMDAPFAVGEYGKKREKAAKQHEAELKRLASEVDKFKAAVMSCKKRIAEASRKMHEETSADDQGLTESHVSEEEGVAARNRAEMEKRADANLAKKKARQERLDRQIKAKLALKRNPKRDAFWRREKNA